MAVPAFKRAHYVPVLKAKQGEFAALSTHRDRSSMTPLLEFVPPSEAPKLRHVIDLTLKRLLPSVGPKWPFFFDTQHLGNAELDGAHCLRVIAERLQEAGLKATPVIGIARTKSHQVAAAAAVKILGGDVCLRLTAKDFDSWRKLNSGISDALNVVGTTVDRTHLVIDAGAVCNMGGETVAGLFAANMNLVRMLTGFKTVTVAAAAFPDGVSDLVANSWNYVPRADWLAWLALGNYELKRMPAFGDYGIASPKLPHTGPAKILAQLRYTHEQNFLVWKGADIRKEGYEQFFGICEQLVELPEFRGPEFSSGDAVIAEKAEGSGTSGNPTKWREIANSHHFAEVSHGLATPVAT